MTFLIRTHVFKIKLIKYLRTIERLQGKIRSRVLLLIQLVVTTNI